jgi:hypothetical protein
MWINIENMFPIELIRVMLTERKVVWWLGRKQLGLKIKEDWKSLICQHTIQHCWLSFFISSITRLIYLGCSVHGMHCTTDLLHLITRRMCGILLVERHHVHFR